MKKTLILTLILQSLLSQAQFQKKVSIYPSQLKSLGSININPDFEFSSVTIAANDENDFENAYLIAQQDTFWLNADEHDSNDSIVFSNLIIFNNNQQEIKFHQEKQTGELTFHFLNAYTTATKSTKKTQNKDDNCLTEPESISQEIWRSGLPEPDYERIVHEVHNLIIHHSAGSNTDTNYTNVIRNIYLYHTQSLQWSDIGYNYIIAQNGQLFDGRDPGDYEQDNVLGAHFCGSNTGTMGICVLGNYEDVQATDTSLITLEKLLAWKASKDSINVYSTYSHPLNSTLDCIAGHRDGCSTLCPGENLYNVLPTIRYKVDSILNAYGYNFEITTIESQLETNKQLFTVNYQAKTIDLISTDNNIKQVCIYDRTGKRKKQSTDLHPIGFNDWPQGLYIIRIETDDQSITNKLLLY
jgi:hypothetical protein